LVTIDAADPGAWCQESKACLVNLTPLKSKESEQFALIASLQDERRPA
jgi:hypothetical protein